MQVVICQDEEQVGAVAADRVIAQLAGRNTLVLGFATGTSPLRLYSELQRRAEEGDVDFSQALGFALDEYVGLDPQHPLSYRQTINRTVVKPLGIHPDRVWVPNGFAADLNTAAEEFENAIREAGGVDVQILGIGSDGHIGFNEPTSSFSSRTRIKTLTQQTRDDNARFFDDESVPTHCVTQGLGTIMDARNLVMVASGEKKAEVVAAMIEGPVSAMCPASILQFHRRAFVIIDEAAASQLKYADYFRNVTANEPAGLFGERAERC